MSLDLNAIAEEILVAHQRHKGGCLCGWSELGKSHPGHQVAMLCEAGIWNDCAEARAELARCVDRLDLDAWDRLEAERDRLRGEVDKARAAGFAQAVAMLRDDQRYANWWTALPQQDPAYGYWQAPARRHLADYLETIGLPAKPSGEAGLDPNAPPIEAVLHTLGNVIAPDEPTGRTRCPLCKTLPIGHEGDCEP